MKLKKVAFMFAIIMVFTSFSFAAESAKGKTIRLETFSGDVEVKSGSGKEISVSEKMRVFDGYTIKTFNNSEAYLSLDDTKAVKLGMNTEVKIKKSWFSNKIVVISGELFFNVTKPLENNESLNISTSTMSMGIRGTSGSVVSNGNNSYSQIYTGMVEVCGSGKKFYIRSGEQALSNDDLQILRLKSDGSEIPAIALSEINKNEKLKDEIKEQTELDVDNFVEQEKTNFAREQQNRQKLDEEIQIIKENAIKEKQENKKSSTINKSVTGKSSGTSSIGKTELTWEILKTWLEQNSDKELDDFVNFASDYSSSLNISGYNNLTDEYKMKVKMTLLGDDDELYPISRLLYYEKMEVLVTEFNGAISAFDEAVIM